MSLCCERMLSETLVTFPHPKFQSNRLDSAYIICIDVSIVSIYECFHLQKKIANDSSASIDTKIHFCIKDSRVFSCNNWISYLSKVIHSTVQYTSLLLRDILALIKLTTANRLY